MHHMSCMHSYVAIARYYIASYVGFCMPLAIHMYGYMVASCIATCTSRSALESGAAIALYLLYAGLLISLIPYMDILSI